MASLPPPSFFSLILDKSATNLKISTEFVTKHLKNKIPKGPIIICADGGYSWRIEIKKIGENYYFDSGWTNVVKDANFMFGDFVLFTLVEKYKFEMFVYDKNSCERSLPKKVKVEDDSSSSVDNVAANVDVVNDDDDVDDNEDDDVDDGKEEEEDGEEDNDVVDIDGDDGDPLFTSTISKAHRTNLRLPDEFVKLAGIEDVRSIMLKNLDGEEWRTDLRPDKVNQSENLYISLGWAKFQQSNDLWEGDECVFKFITSENKILLAKVTKKERPARQSQPSGECSKTDSVKRKRGRELHAHGRDVDVESEDEYMQLVKRLCGNDEDEEHEDSDEIEDGEGDNDDVDGDEGEEDYEEKDGVDIDGNPFFKLTIRNGYKSHLRFPANFVRLARIKAAGTITLKNLDGEESSMSLRLQKNSQPTYYISLGWPGFRRSNKIAIGDECVFKYITSESKFCLAKVTKKKKSTRQPQPSAKLMRTDYVKRKRGQSLHEHGRDMDLESEDECMEVMKRLCGNDEDYKHEDSDEDEDGEGDNDDVDGDEGEEDYEEKDGVDMDGNPYFKLTIRNGYKSHLRFPANFVRLARIEAAGTITLMNLDGEESSMSLRLQKNSQKTYYISLGWSGFRQSNKLAIGDECVFKYITSESKFCLAKVTKKKKSARQPEPSAKLMRTDYVKRKRGQSLHEHGRDKDVESEDECMEVMKRLRGNDEDDEHEDSDEDEDGEGDNDDVDGDEGEEDYEEKNGVDIDGNPYFKLTIRNVYKSHLVFPSNFVRLARIEAAGTITLKNLDGEESSMSLRLVKNTQKTYYISLGWAGFRRSNKVAIGDECVFKYIKSERKFCLAKVTKKKKSARQPQPSAELMRTDYVKRKWGRSLHEHGGDMDVESEDECVEVMKRTCGEDSDKDNDEDNNKIIDNDINDDDDSNNDNDGDDEDDRNGDIAGDPFFTPIISRHRTLLLPKEFVGLPGIHAGGTILLKNLKGEEWQIGVLLNKSYKSERYLLSAGWVGFLRSNDISVGDECLLKYIRKETKFCLAKVTEKQRPAWQPQPPVEDIDGNPLFMLIISGQSTLRLPEKFVELSGIHADETIKLKNNKGEEWQIGVLLDALYHKSERYIFSAGWLGFQQSNDLSIGDECIIKFIRKEGKFCLAKVTKKQKQAWNPQPSGQILATKDVKRKRGLPPHEQGGDVGVESEDDCVELVKRPCGEDDNDDDNYEDKDNNINDDDNHNHNDGEDEADGGGGGDIDGDPFFASIISRLHTLRLPGEFVGYPGINANGTIMLKNLKGEEWRIGVLLDKTYLKSERYILSAGMLDFMQNNDILVGDECVIKLIRNEGKLCLAKVTKKCSPARQPLPSGDLLATTEVVKRNRGQPVLEDLGDVDVKNEDERVEVVQRLCSEDHDEENDCQNDGLDNGINNGKDNDNDGDDNKHGDVGDPSFSMIVSKRPFLALPEEFVGLPGIEAGGSITMKNLKGEEWSLGVRLNQAYRKSVRYILTAGCREFLRRNNLSEGDECVYKFIRNEGKLCLAKVTKNKRQLQREPAELRILKL